MKSTAQTKSVKSKRDLISIADLGLDEINLLFDRAADLKTLKEKGGVKFTLPGKTLAMLFEKPSTRTRVGFEVAMTQLGGHAINLAPEDTQLGRDESLSDTAKILAGYCDCILIRTFGHDRVVELAKHGAVPVINGLSDLLHPCQILSDLFTIKGLKGSLEGVKVAYVGDGNNVANSWILGASKTGVELALACPEGHDPDPNILAMGLEGTGAKINVVRDPVKAVKDAHIIYTDTWTSMGQEKEAKIRRKIFAPYQVNRKLLEAARQDAYVMHCLPAHRGEEITDEVADGPRSIIFPQAENRLYMQKAILEWLMGVYD